LERRQDLIRISVGTEHIDDIIHDFEQSFAAASIAKPEAVSSNGEVIADKVDGEAAADKVDVEVTAEKANGVAEVQV
jgi:hypothetical protein